MRVIGPPRAEVVSYCVTLCYAIIAFGSAISTAMRYSWAIVYRFSTEAVFQPVDSRNPPSPHHSVVGFS
jgi:hypothetical protein